jgi:hypothetical protein
VCVCVCVCVFVCVLHLITLNVLGVEDDGACTGITEEARNSEKFSIQ